MLGREIWSDPVDRPELRAWPIPEWSRYEPPANGEWVRDEWGWWRFVKKEPEKKAEAA